MDSRNRDLFMYIFLCFLCVGRVISSPRSENCRKNEDFHSDKTGIGEYTPYVYMRHIIYIYACMCEIVKLENKNIRSFVMRQEKRKEENRRSFV